MLPFNNLIPINRSSATPVYLQVCNSIIRLIRDGILKKGYKLPGTRSLSEILNIHRKTVVAAFTELSAQGWIQIKPSNGAFISDALPDITPKSFQSLSVSNNKITGFYIKSNEFINTQVYKKSNLIEINDGLPDERLAPMESLSRSIRAILKGERGRTPLSYSEIEGSRQLRTELSIYLNETRGVNTSVNNVFITRGTIMALYLSMTVLLEKGDNIIVETPGYRVVTMIVRQLGGTIIYAPVDENGLIVEEVQKLCMIKKIRALYVTPHHHYPTGVTIPPERRIALLALAEKYGIAILEDDYDYDFHYLHSPFLPLASTDPAGCVIYIGSFSKTFSPAFRVGYLSAPENFISEITKQRRIMDRQGDSILELALAEMFKLGEIKSHLKKSHTAYKGRRDLFCKLLADKVGEDISFKIPEGGMALWGKFSQKVDLPLLSKHLQAKGLYLSDGKNYNASGQFENSTRMGFASLNSEEIEEAISLLAGGIKYLRK